VTVPLTQSDEGRAVESRRSRGPGVDAERILEKALELFGSNGYKETKWADIAVGVDISSRALYRHFESKPHCLYEAMAAA
jgi:AcrR family transcriptional regulator